ncbi:uncharacterized protein LOC121054173 [Oryza brachyantha]|uniref:uncharacterized protein LOC121054173 n=1 Tax=Oryza brachyantha TaxID=4533 RepID=UPI001ADBECE3|nr:uncharacterized protein LOC121054173 [Oryza brachyantha]
MAKRPRACCCSGRAAKRPAQAQRRQHLYVVLEDWERGYSIHKVDVEAFDPDAADHPDSDEDDGVPPVVRVEAKHGCSSYFAAYGSKILAMFPVSGSPGVAVLHTESSGLSVYPLLSIYSRVSHPLFASVRGILFKISPSSMEMLGAQPPAMDDGGDKRWAWENITAYSQPPFNIHRAVCHALHPDGRTLFVSVRMDATEHTFSFEADEHLEWRHRGEWMLPFQGQAYYVAELDAWVGLCRRSEGLGHVCSCDLAPPLSAASPSGEAAAVPMPPRWKLCGERLFDPDDKRHQNAKLVRIGSRRFCLLEAVGHRHGHRPMRPVRRVLRMTTFRLRYGKNGELEIAASQAAWLARPGRTRSPTKV